jgi:hypothetical protein
VSDPATSVKGIRPQMRNNKSLKSLKIATERFEQVSMDFITNLPVTKENHDAVMGIVDKLTKLVMFIPTRTDMDRVETAKKFFYRWYRWFDLPKKILSDTTS